MGLTGVKRRSITIKCYCPKCGKTHKRKERYIGPAAVPPFFCQECRYNQEKHSMDSDMNEAQQVYAQYKGGGKYIKDMMKLLHGC